MAKYDTATRLYRRINRVEKGADYLFEISGHQEVADLIMDCHRTSLVASRLMQVSQAQRQMGLSFSLSTAEVQERVQVLEMRLEDLLAKWIATGTRQEVKDETVFKTLESQTCARCGGPKSNKRNTLCQHCVGKATRVHRKAKASK